MQPPIWAIDSSALISWAAEWLFVLFGITVAIAIVIRVIRAVVSRKPELIKEQVLQPLMLPASVQEEVTGVRPSDNSDLFPRTDWPSPDHRGR